MNWIAVEIVSSAVFSGGVFGGLFYFGKKWRQELHETHIRYDRIFEELARELGSSFANARGDLEKIDEDIKKHVDSATNDVMKAFEMLDERMVGAVDSAKDGLMVKSELIRGELIAAHINLKTHAEDFAKFSQDVRRYAQQIIDARGQQEPAHIPVRMNCAVCKREVVKFKKEGDKIVCLDCIAQGARR